MAGQSMFKTHRQRHYSDFTITTKNMSWDNCMSEGDDVCDECKPTDVKYVREIVIDCV